ncbi:MAG TPA: hypothetical protein VK545_17275 [Streptomyces sp.]|nr:hypothetical protein [Streptomyces sp.]
MGCGCNKNRTRYQVVSADGNKVLLQPTVNKALAEASVKRYPGSRMEELPAPGRQAAQKTAPKKL